MLEIKNFTKSYVKGINAADDITLTVNDGEIFGFIGHNGAGKTTTIKAIVGTLDFDQGEILLDNLNIKTNPIEFKQKVAYIPDNPEVYNNLTGMQYLDFIVNIYNLEDEYINEEINKYATEFELVEELNNEINTYSHGMKQKLLLISAFIRNPKLLILDEPFTGLDPNATFKMKQQMKKLAESGAIIFFSTHVLEVAEKFCDTIGIIRNGKLMKVGSMQEVKGDKSLESVFMELLENE
ncbi:MAG TPA: ABC transporter ATP-binding protein [Acholeplasma sp.]|nr:ABC transporter ATP-binding protein [Acholeplasma sp.]